MKLSLIPRLTLVFVLFAALLLVGVGWVSYENGRTALQASATSELLSAAIQKETELNGWVDERLADLSALAASPALREDVTRLVSAPDTQGKRAARDRLVANLRPSIGRQFLELFVLHPVSGKILASTHAAQEGKFKKTDPYFINGVLGSFVKNPYQSATLKAPAMSMSTPLHSDRQQLLGVLVARLDLKALDAIVGQRTGVRRTDDAYLINPASQFVTQPRFISEPVALKRIVHTEATRRSLQGNSGILTAPDYRGKNAIIVYRWLPERGLGLILKVDQAEALAPAYAFGRTILLISGLALLLASGLAVGLARGISQPIRALQSGVARFGQGDSDLRLPENSNDEVGLLAREFNQMALMISAKEAQLHVNAAQLEQRVAERTTELETAKAEVEQAARANRNMMAYSQDVICSIDESGRFISVSPACENVWGYSPEELSGQLYIELVHPDDVEKTNRVAAEIMNGDAQDSFENRYLRRDGVAVNMLWSAVWSDAEKSMFCVARDITERKQAEEELRASQQRTRSIIDAAHDAYIAMDGNNLIVDWNRQAEAIFGWSREEALGRSLAETLIPHQYREAHHRGMRHFLATGEGPVLNKAFEITALHRDGHEFPIELSISPLRWSDSYIFSSFLRDITVRKQDIEELQRAKIAAEEANHAKTQFLANMSHEIRTPMNGVLGPIGLLLDSNLTAQQRVFTEIARSSAELLLGIINDILDLSKIEVGKLDIEPIPFDLLLAVEETAGLMVSKAEEKDIDLIVRYPIAVPRYIVGDPGRIRQVLANLISNAIKFTARGHILINIEVAEEAEKAQSSDSTARSGEVLLRFNVEDTGIGIAADKIEHVFGRFNQADTSTTRRYGGTGLGLSISRQLVELMGGEIGATSVLGEGSIFSFTLRLPLQSDAPVFSLPDANLSGVRILIVDDNAVNRRVLHEQLNNWNLRNDSAATCVEALEMLQTAKNEGDPFQIAILDYQMPDMNGETLGRTIKADVLLSDTILLMLTSLGHKGDAIRLRAAGFAAYLLKPARQSELLGALINVWTARNSNASPEMVTRFSVAEGSPERQDTPRRWEGIRVLVAEDNIVNQKVATMILQNFGCHVEIAANGHDALKRIESLPFDIIFMDCEMPEMDGYEATAEIRQRADDKRNLPIIAVTAKATKGAREFCLQSGMDDYMSKPVKSEDFQAALERWVPDGKKNTDTETFVASVSETVGVPTTSLDAEVVTRLRDLAAATDAALLGQIFDSFVSDGEARLDTLHRALEESDAVALHKTAHALKGASGNIGARRMATLAGQLQTMGENGSVEGAAAVVGKLEEEFHRVRSEISAELKNSP